MHQELSEDRDARAKWTARRLMHVVLVLTCSMCLHIGSSKKLFICTLSSQARTRWLKSRPSCGLKRKLANAFRGAGVMCSLCSWRWDGRDVERCGGSGAWVWESGR